MLVNKQYVDLTKEVWSNGNVQEGRNGTTRVLVAPQLRVDMALGFPILAFKKVNFEACVGENIAFFYGATNVQQFKELGCNYWDKNAQADYWLNNKNNRGNGDLGRIYGAQWRLWQGLDSKGCIKTVDQLGLLLKGLREDPYGRRHIVTSWQPAEFDQMALPPCHSFFQVICETDNKISLVMYQRSADLVLGVPSNIVGYALILQILAAMTGRQASNLILNFGNCHIYEVHEKEDFAVSTTLAEYDNWAQKASSKVTLEIDNLNIKSDFSWDSMAEWAKPQNFRLHGYNPGPWIKARMVE